MDPNLAATAILNHQSPAVAGFCQGILSNSSDSEFGFLKTLHAAIAIRIAPVYSVNELQPVSHTIAIAKGSCSQRIACLEALARRNGIGTRVRVLWLRGSFWRPRFPHLSVFLPQRILLLWPQFRINGGWLDFDQLYAEELRRNTSSGLPFRNDGESLFEAVATTRIDFTSQDGTKDGCPCTGLSEFLLEDCGFFNSRDAALKRFGNLYETLPGRIFEFLYGGKPSRQHQC